MASLTRSEYPWVQQSNEETRIEDDECDANGDHASVCSRQGTARIIGE